jgi:ACS family hexuronate transporter-like MFS transporter
MSKIFSKQGDSPKAHVFVVTTWLLLILAGCVTLLSNLDRAILTQLKTTFSNELGISNTDYSILVTSFMVPYIGMYFFVGKWVDKYGTRFCITVFLSIISLSTLLFSFAHGLWSMAAMRFIFGAASAGILPAIFVAVTKWFPVNVRATALAITAPLGTLGTIIAPPFTALITLKINWQMAFWIPGVAGLLLALSWYIIDKSKPDQISEEKQSQLKIVLQNKGLWYLFTARIITDPFWFILQFWQVAYFQEKLGLSLAQTAQLLWIPPVGQSILGIFLGWFSDHLIKRGMPALKARAIILSGLIILTPCIFVLAWTHNVTLAVCMLLLVQFLGRSWLSGASLLASELVPSSIIASTISIMSALAGLSSLVLNAVAGPLIDRFGYSLLFSITGLAFPLASYLIWKFYYNPKVVNYKNETTP